MRALEFHCWPGRFYLLEVALGSVAGFAMAVVSKEGLATRIGFGTLAVLWFFTGLQAYRKVRQGRIAEHRQMDDPELCADAGSGNTASLHSVDALGPALAVPSNVHHSGLVVLGAESGDRGVHCEAAAATDGTRISSDLIRL